MSVLAPTSLAEALDALASDADAQALAGGTDFMVEVNAGHRRPRSVVSLGRVPELRGWSLGEGVVVLGAGLTYVEMLDAALAGHCPALAQAARTVGSPQIRAAGTLGGNLATASPAGDTLAVLSALDATVVLACANGQRRLGIHEFLLGPKRTALAAGELVLAAEVPVAAGPQEFCKVGTRSAMVIAIANLCLVVDRAARTVTVAMGSVGPTVLRGREAEAWVAPHLDWDAMAVAPGVARDFAAAVLADARPIDDHRSTRAYRRASIATLAERALRRAFPAGGP